MVDQKRETGNSSNVHPDSAGKLNSRSLAQIESKPVEWLWHGRIPFGMFSMIDGDPSKGKSLISLDIAARLSKGGSMPLCTAPESGPRKVLILAAEDTPEHVIRPRAIAAGADPENVRVCETIMIGKYERPICFPEDFRSLEREIEAHGIGLVLVDPLLGFLGQSIDSNKDQSVREVLHQMKLIAERTGAAILGLRHLGKAGSGNPLYRGLGSIAITAVARSAMAVDAHPSDENSNILATTKCNLVKLPPSVSYRIVDQGGHPIIEWGSECDITAAELGMKLFPANRRQREDAKEFLRELLADCGGMSSTEIKTRAAAAGISIATLSRARKDLSVRAKKQGFGPNSHWLWNLPLPSEHAL